jgi:hypothetical protein
MLIAASVRITLYGSFYLGQTISANVTLDGDTNTTTTTPFVASATGPSFSFFDVQSLPYKDHNATVLLYNGTNNQYPNIYFDYVAVNDTSSSISPIPSSSALRLVVFLWIQMPDSQCYTQPKCWCNRWRSHWGFGISRDNRHSLLLCP